jgi:putative acetyltransferase
MLTTHRGNARLVIRENWELGHDEATKRQGRQMIPYTVRAETPLDQAAIHDLTRRAFQPMPFSDGDEPELVDKLRQGGALSLSLVAIGETKLLGHVAFSPATNEASSANWFALGPVSVEPDHQRQGIGSALILEGLRSLRTKGAAGCILVGNPLYYRRFGFLSAPELSPKREPEEYFMLLAFREHATKGRFAFHRLFYEEL